MVLPDSNGISRVPLYSGSTLERPKCRLQGYYLLWRTFPGRFIYFDLFSLCVKCPTTPRGKPLGLGSSRFARRYYGNRVFFLFLRVLRCFSSPGMPSISYQLRDGYCSIKNSGFPHSEIFGSKLAYSSPKHIGVSPVLHRLLVPRHSPCALSNLILDKNKLRIRASASSHTFVCSDEHSIASFFAFRDKRLSLKIYPKVAILGYYLVTSSHII